MNNKTPNEKIKLLRQEQGMTRVFLAKKSGIDYKRLQRIEEEHAVARLDELMALSKVLGIKVESLV